MCGAMAWCCLRSGQWGRSHFLILTTVKSWSSFRKDSVKPHLLVVPDPSIVSWWIAGEIL